MVPKLAYKKACSLEDSMLFDSVDICLRRNIIEEYVAVVIFGSAAKAELYAGSKRGKAPHRRSNHSNSFLWTLNRVR